MEEFKVKIEKNIPIPSRITGSQYSEILDNMEIGDSFKVEIKIKDRIMAHIYACRKELHEKYCTRKVDDGHFRIWKLENRN